MTRITVLGGTGYVGSNIVAEAAKRGLVVVSLSRTAPESPITGVDYQLGSVQHDDALQHAIEGADVVVSALSPRGELAGNNILRSVEKKIAKLTMVEGARLGVVGGAGSLRTAEGGPMLHEGSGFPEAVKPEAIEMAGVLDDLNANTSGIDWFYVSPAAEFGSHNPGEATGVYRVGGDVVLTDAEGKSFISGADLALAVVDEILHPKHSCTRFTVAY